MPTKFTKKIDFSGQDFYIGLDVHKKSWVVTVLTEGLALKTFSQPPSASTLAEYMNHNYPNGNYFSAYEAGFCGYNPHRQLINLGIQNIVVNPADIPRMNKELVYQTDKSDSRSIARGLRDKQLNGIYIFNPSEEEFRSLFRHRLTIAKDIRKACNRIKGFLFYRSVTIPPQFDNSNWSNAFLSWLDQLPLGHLHARNILDRLVANYKYCHKEKLAIEAELRTIAKAKDEGLYKLLTSVPGIGPITAIGIMAEIGDINRFKHIKQLASYVGLIPRISQSGDKETTGSITYRHNGYLRPLLVESAWQAVRSDPVMLEYYKKACSRGNSKKAIIKVARKMLSRTMYVMKNRKEYQNNVL
jgi:transposase